MNDKSRGRRTRAIAMRALALLLIVAILGSALLYRKADVAINVGTLENRGAKLAVQQLMAPGTYSGASRLERMGTYARSFLGRLNTFDDCDRAAQIAIAQADFDGAAAYTRKAIELADDRERGMIAALNTRMGYLYTLMEDYPAALEWLDRGLAVTESPAARLIRAQVRLNLGDAQGALVDLETYLGGKDIAWEMLPNIVNIYEAAGRYDDAVTCYTVLIEATGEPEYMLDRAYCYTCLGRMEEATADCAQYAAAGGTETASAEAMLGNGWLRGSDYDQAGACFIRSLEQGYAEPEALYYYIVLCAYVTGDDARACEYGDTVVERLRTGEPVRSADVGMEDATGRLKVSLVPMDESSLCMMTGASHLRLEQYGQAVDCLTMCVARNADDGFARYLRASSLLALGRFEEAAADFDAAIAAGEDEERCRYGRAVCRRQLGDAEGALEDFDWVLLHGTDQGLFDEASRLMRELMGDTPDAGNGDGPSGTPD